MNLFYAKSKNGLIFDNQKAIRDYLASVEGKSLIVQIDRETGVRSMNQNSYLFGVVYRTIASETGHTEQEIHEIMKRKFLPAQFIAWKGQPIRMPGSTTRLNKIEFSDFVERIRAEVSVMGIIIPEADKYYQFKKTKNEDQ